MDSWEREREREREGEDNELGCDRVKRIKKRILLTLLMIVSKFIEYSCYLLNVNKFYFFLAELKKGISGMVLSTSCHVTVMDNITCTIRALLGLLLKPLLYECKTRTPTIKPRLRVVLNANNWVWCMSYLVIFLPKLLVWLA